MPVLHFLNVGEGDCTIIQHGSGRVTMVDVSKARIPNDTIEEAVKKSVATTLSTAGNFGQKNYPSNPVEYMKDRGIDDIFRFVLTHPDMDHLDGIADLFSHIMPTNFWDTDNTCDKDNDDWSFGRYRREDWDYYKKTLRAGMGPKRLTYHSDQTPCDFWKDDGLKVLAPTPALVSAANEAENWNDSSYVLLYTAKHPKTGEPKWKVVITGDAHDDTWEHVLNTHAHLIGNIDLLLAPHHGRHSDGDHSYLDTLKPKLTLFGNAPSEHMAYQPWLDRDLPKITNNQAANIVVDFDTGYGSVYCTHKKFAESKVGSSTYFDATYKAWACAFLR